MDWLRAGTRQGFSGVTLTVVGPQLPMPSGMNRTETIIFVFAFSQKSFSEYPDNCLRVYTKTAKITKCWPFLQYIIQQAKLVRNMQKGTIFVKVFDVMRLWHVFAKTIVFVKIFAKISSPNYFCENACFSDSCRFFKKNFIIKEIFKDRWSSRFVVFCSSQA